MPPKITFTRDDVIDAAFNIVREEGLRDLSARKIADHLNSSTSPVYSYFASMDELKREVLGRAESMMREYARRPYTSSVFLNMGTGLTEFARDNRALFHAMFLENNDSLDIINSFYRSLSDEVMKDDLVSTIPRVERREVMRRMAIFTHGFASMVCVGLVKDADKNFIIKTMYEMGRDVIDCAFRKQEKAVEE
jgi:AcrR family transcriptional regulator